MATKRQPSKQRRQAQNQKQRAALEARRQAAAAAGSGAAAAGQAEEATTSSSSGGGGGSVLSRFRSASSAGKAARTGGAGTPVGQRAALSALVAAVAAAIVGSFLFKVPVDRNGEVITTRGALVAEWTLTAQEATADAPSDATTAEIAASIDDWLPGGEEPYAKAFWPMSATVLLPVIGTALGFRAVSRRSSAKVVNRTMYVTLFGALLASQLLILFLPAVISLAVAAFQVRKAEVAAAASAPDGVIDVDEIDHVDDVDDVEADDVDVDAGDEVEDRRR